MAPPSRDKIREYGILVTYGRPHKIQSSGNCIGWSHYLVMTTKNGGKAVGRLRFLGLAAQSVIEINLSFITITLGKTIHPFSGKFHVSKTELTHLHLSHSSERLPHLGWPQTPPFCRSMADLFFWSLWSLPLFRSQTICNHCIPQSAGFPATDLSDLPAAQLSPHPPVQIFSPNTHRTMANSPPQYIKPSVTQSILSNLLFLPLFSNSRFIGHPVPCFPNYMVLLTEVSFHRNASHPPISKSSV